jgi:hypothetical protein
MKKKYFLVWKKNQAERRKGEKGNGLKKNQRYLKRKGSIQKKKGKF